MTTKEKKPCVYMRLFHGRLDPDERLKGWGFDGPVLGPFDAIYFAYRTHIRCILHDTVMDMELVFHDDLLVYHGKYYGDFEIVSDPS
jgi:hypothetical protein